MRPPAPQLLASVEGLAATAKAQTQPVAPSQAPLGALIEALVGAIDGSRFAFDLHHRLHRTLIAGGAAYRQAAAAHQAMLLGVLRRLPGLLDLRFRDRTPFASPQTQQWLVSKELAGQEGKREDAHIVAPSAMAQAKSVDLSSGDSFGQADTLRRQAIELATQGHLDAAVARLEALRNKATCGHQRFVLSLDLTEACYLAGATDVAGGLLHGLAQGARRIDLMSWEPKLAARLYSLQCRLANHAECSESARGDTPVSQDAFADLCALDVTEALRLEGRRKAGCPS